jgi:hypothetical protein
MRSDLRRLLRERGALDSLRALVSGALGAAAGGGGGAAARAQLAPSGVPGQAGA